MPNPESGKMPMLHFMPGASSKPKVNTEGKTKSKTKAKKSHNPGSHNPY